MKIQLKHPRSIDGKLFAPGVHDMPDALADHWFLKALMKDGDAVLIGAPPKLPPKEDAQLKDELSSDEEAGTEGAEPEEQEEQGESLAPQKEKKGKRSKQPHGKGL